MLWEHHADFVLIARDRSAIQPFNIPLSWVSVCLPRWLPSRVFNCLNTFLVSVDHRRPVHVLKQPFPDQSTICAVASTAVVFYDYSTHAEFCVQHSLTLSQLLPFHARYIYCILLFLFFFLTGTQIELIWVWHNVPLKGSTLTLFRWGPGPWCLRFS